MTAGPQAPAWAAALRTGHWHRISGDAPDLKLPPTPPGTRHLADNDPACDPSLNPPHSNKEWLRRKLGRQPRAPWSGRMGFPAITEAWNSAAFASHHSNSGAMLVFGGGHNNYFGSDVHAFDLASRRWQRLSDGYTKGRPGNYGAGAIYPQAVYPDGSPLPPHTGGYLQYDPRDNALLLLKGQTELGPDVKAIAIPHRFELAGGCWQRGRELPDAILNSGGCSAWDPTRRLLFGHSGDEGGGNAFVAWCPDHDNPDRTRGTWRPRHPNKMPGQADHNALAYSPPHDRLVFARHADDTLAALDPDNPAAPLIPVPSTGDHPRLQPFAALEYAPACQSLIYFSAADAGRVYSVKLGARAHWSPITNPDSLDPITDAAHQSQHETNHTHTFGRFRIATYEDLTLAILIRHTDTPVYAMRVT